MASPIQMSRGFATHLLRRVRTRREQTGEASQIACPGAIFPAVMHHGQTVLSEARDMFSGGLTRWVRSSASGPSFGILIVF